MHALGQAGLRRREIGRLREVFGQVVQFNLPGAVCAAELVAVPNQHRVERAIKMEPDPGPPNDALAAIEQDWLDGTALNALGLFFR